MARPQPHQGDERQPQHFGAAILQYSFGIAATNAQTPLVWFPGVARDPEAPYRSRGWRKDFRKLCAIIAIEEERGQGPFISMVLGGGARRVVDDAFEEESANGAAMQADQGNLFQVSEYAFIMRMTVQAFIVNEEQDIFRAGSDFFAFAPRPYERRDLVFGSPGDMVEGVDDATKLGISDPFRTWMLVSVMRFTPHKWGRAIGGDGSQNATEGHTVQTIVSAHLSRKGF